MNPSYLTWFDQAAKVVEVRQGNPKTEVWRVWLTNGLAGQEWVGSMIAECQSELDAELVKTSLELLRDRRTPCEAVIFHGPGHQSRSDCEVRGAHEVHRNTRTGRVLEWTGDEGMTDYFDESPGDDL